jgi:transposase-like protein
MAKSAKSVSKAGTGTRKRLTPDQKQEIAESLARGEAGNQIAARLGVAAATVYAQRRKQTDAGHTGESALRSELASFGARMLLGQEVPAEERETLRQRVQDEVMRRITAI